MSTNNKYLLQSAICVRAYIKNRMTDCLVDFGEGDVTGVFGHAGRKVVSEWIQRGYLEDLGKGVYLVKSKVDYFNVRFNC